MAGPTSSRLMPPGGSGKRSRARSPTRRAPSASRCIWSTVSAKSYASRARCSTRSAASPRPRSLPRSSACRSSKVRKVLKIAKEPLSLETPIGDEENSHLGDFIEDKNAILPSDAAIQSNLRETTTRTLALLTPREERVIRMRFGIGINKDHTLEEVGQRFSVTRERIRQIEAKALRKLKHPSRSRILRSFLHD